MNAHTTIETAPVLREHRGPIAILTLNRPGSRNALSDAMIAGLTAELDAIATDKRVRAVVIAAHGPAFSAGHDLKEVTRRRSDPDRGRASFAALFDECSALMMRIVRLPQPVIAAVEGVATAAGCQLVASCDLAVAGAAARFATPGVNIGLFCSTPMVALTRNVPRKRAMEMLLLGDLVDAEEAARLGLVNRVVAAGDALEEAIRLAEQIASKSAATLRVGKRAFYEQAEMGLGEAYAHTGRVMVENMLGQDAEEGIGAFVEKRAPVWSDG
jgi:enoyl-CoA hydratase/carnithine racemase